MLGMRLKVIRRGSLGIITIVCSFAPWDCRLIKQNTTVWNWKIEANRELEREIHVDVDCYLWLLLLWYSEWLFCIAYVNRQNHWKSEGEVRRSWVGVFINYSMTIPYGMELPPCVFFILTHWFDFSGLIHPFLSPYLLRVCFCVSTTQICRTKLSLPWQIR